MLAQFVAILDVFVFEMCMTLTLNGPRSKVNTAIELCMMLTLNGPRSKFNTAIEMCMTLTLNGPRSKLNTAIERPHAIQYLLAIAMFAPSVTVSEILQ